MPPVEPEPSRYVFDLTKAPPGEDFLGTGADLDPSTVLAAYRAGAFPMPVTRRGAMGWWSPDPRGVIPLDRLRVSRSLRAARRRFQVRVDTAYDEVVRGCADPRRPGGWIRRDIAAAYRRLHDLGFVHSVEAWSVGPGGEERLAGGLYGLAVGGLFAGESMFHRERDASKVALVALVEILRAAGGEGQAAGGEEPAAGGEGRLLDVQWATEHLVSMGAVAVPRTTYLSLLERALPLPTPDFTTPRPHHPPTPPSNPR